MGLHQAPFAPADCACCPPGSSRKLVEHKVALPADSRHQFLRAAQPYKLPRDVLLRIFALATTVERRVEKVHHFPPARHRKRQPPPSSSFDTSFAELCIEDAPP